MKNLKIYKCQTFLPTIKENKKKKSAILMLTPNFNSSKNLMNHPLFVNKKRFESYFLERDVAYYIDSNNVSEVDESALVNEYSERSIYLETKRSEIPDDQFGVPSKRKFPLDTCQRVRSAIKFFNYVDPEDEEELAKRIIKKMKECGIDDINVGEKNRFSKYYHPKKNEID